MAIEVFISSSKSREKRVYSGCRKAQIDDLIDTSNGFALFPFEGNDGFIFSDDAEVINVPWEGEPASDTSKSYYINSIETAQHRFNEEFQKVVLARQKSFDLNQVPSAENLIESLTSAYPDAFCYVVCWNDLIFFGASPEVLLHSNPERIESMALAGTLPLDGNKAFGTKEIEEQQFVCDFLEEAASTSGLAEVHRSKRFEQPAGHLKHLCTTYHWKNNATGLSRFLKQIHPTPAVAGTPRNRAIEFIKNHETFNRQFYAGFLGPVDSGNLDLYVNLRCGVIYENRCYLYAGAGISKDSDAPSEWEETEAKLQTLLRFF